MAAALIYSLSPLKINSTVLAVENVGLTPNVLTEPFRHSGNEFASVLAVPGGNPALTFRTPFAEAYALIGLKFLKVTTLEVYLAKFVDALRQTGAVHRKYVLASSPGAATGFAYITGASVAQNGVLMADVAIALVSYDGMTHPLVPSDTGTLPTLASQPVLYTNGPATINGTTIGGTTGFRLDNPASMDLRRHDGDMFPRVCGFFGWNPSLIVDHGDPATLWSTLGLLGVNATANLVQYAKQYDATTQIVTSTALSFTIASGRAVPDNLSVSNLVAATAPMRFIPLSSTATHPIVIASGATAPTP